MPYCNFDDTHSLRSMYHESQEEDRDMNISEFIFEKLLTIGELFEDEEDEKDIPKNHHPAPLEMQPLQSGSLFCLKIIIVEKETEPVAAKPSCLFRENKFSFDFHAPIFHPPATLG